MSVVVIKGSLRDDVAGRTPDSHTQVVSVPRLCRRTPAAWGKPNLPLATCMCTIQRQRTASTVYMLNRKENVLSDSRAVLPPRSPIASAGEVRRA